MRVFLWSGRTWRLDGTVSGPLSGGQWVAAASLTGSRVPDFTVTSCGAGGITCMSVISKAGGRWRAVPFEYGYGTSLVVDGAAVGNLVLTNSASYEPPTRSYHRYVNGTFVPAEPPGPSPKCGKSALEWAATTTRAIRFNHIGCEAGWALAVGNGAGLTGQTVGLFEWDPDGREWRTQTLDNGNLLPATPSMFKLPLTLLTRLAAPAGAQLAPEIAAAKLIAGMESRQPDEFYWPSQNGIVEAGGRRWLIAVIPDGPDPDASTHAPATATIYRWDGAQWVTDGQISNLNQGLNVSWRRGWFVSVPQQAPSIVAFRLVGACCKGPHNDEHRSGRLITNAGGTWHVT